MPDPTNESSPADGTAQPAVPGTTVPAPAAAAASDPAVSTQTQTTTEVGDDGRPITIASKTLKRRLDEARSSARSAAMRELDERAKKLGFTSAEAMFSHNEQRRQPQGKPKPSGQPAPKTDPKPGDAGQAGQQQQAQNFSKRDRRELDRARKIAEEAQRLARVEGKRRRDLQRQLDATEARAALEKIAAGSGIRDVDYAIHLLNRHNERLTDEEIEKLSEEKFFGELRTTHPHIFGERSVPATTGPGNTGTAAPKPGQLQRDIASDGQIDVKKMTREEYEAHLLKRSINVNALQQ